MERDRERRREREARVLQLFDEGRISPAHCRTCGLLLDDPLTVRHADCEAPPIRCGLCGCDDVKRLADHYCRPAPGMPTECERIRAAAIEVASERIRNSDIRRFPT